KDQALLIADRGDIFDFEAASRKIEELLPQGISTKEIFLGQLDPASARAQLLSSLNAGQLLVNYVGHGSVEVWSRQAIFSSADAPGSSSATRPPGCGEPPRKVRRIPRSRRIYLMATWPEVRWS